MTPEMIFGMRAAEYHTADGYGSTAIGAAARWSVAHYLADQSRRPTQGMTTGTLSHLALLEPDEMDSILTVAPRGQCVALTGSAAKRCSRQAIAGATRCKQHGGQAEYDAWRESLPADAIVVSDDELAATIERANGVRASIARLCPPLDRILEGGDREVSIFGEAILTDASPHGYVIDDGADAPDGPRVSVHARIDIYHARAHIAVDLKGVSRRQALTTWGWRRHMREYSYAAQAALYSDMLAACTSQRPTWGWLVHEQDAPYAVRVFEPDAPTLAHGRDMVGLGLRRWHEYERNHDEWHGWPDKLEIIETD